MKIIGKIIKNILISIWVVIAIFTTICLLNYNQYNISEFGAKSFIIVDNEELEPKFINKDLLIVTKEGQKKYKVGDEIFFYYGNRKTNMYVNLGTIDEVQEDEYAENAYYIGETKISYSDVIGTSSNTKIYHNLGLVLGILESRWGFMFIVILPTIFALVYEIYGVVVEVKKESKKSLKKVASDNEE